MEDFRQKWKNTGIYTTAYRYDKEDQAEANLYGDLYLDFDISNLDNASFEMIKEDAIRACSMFSAIFGIDKEQIDIFFSGKKGLHITVPALILGVEPRMDLNEVFRVIAHDFAEVMKHQTLDLKIYDRVRLFRLPNSVHPETGLHKVPLTYEELRTLTYDDIEVIAQKPRVVERKAPRYNTKANTVYRSYEGKWDVEKNHRFSKKKGKGKLDFMPGCIKDILHKEVPEGFRNNTCAALASYFKTRGNSEEKAFEKLMRWNEKRCSPQMKESEIMRTVQSIYNREYEYGCRTYAALGECNSSCKLHKQR